MSMELLSVSEALERMLTHFHPLPPERCDLLDCLGRHLAQDVVASAALPPFASSAMDGYAVRAEDTRAASENGTVRLRVVGDVAAGESDLPQVGPGEAVRVMTGAPLPEGADAVVPVEGTREGGALAGKPLAAEVEITRAVSAGDYLRPAGGDVGAGHVVLRAGHRLRPQDIGMLAALGVAQPLVYGRPRVAVLSSGDELLEPWEPLKPAHIRDANSYALASAARALGAEVLRLGIARDDPQDLRQKLGRAVEAEANLIISSAGVSMGAYDFVRQVVESQGELYFWRINIRPGKPLLFGAYAGIPFMGLPGNPVSALVTFEVFVRPVLLRMSGGDPFDRDRVQVRLEGAVESDGRESYLRARVWGARDGLIARLTGSQDSGVLSSLIAANALLIIPAGVRRLEPGSRVEAWLLPACVGWSGKG